MITEFLATKQGNSVVLLRMREHVYTAEITKVIPADFPIEDAWKYFPLEVTEQVKGDINGRFPSAGRGKETKPDPKKVLELPVYSEKVTIGGLLNRSNFSPKRPFFGMATRMSGCYADERMAQSVAVLVFWKNRHARVLELNWCEGPLIDCITPEWYSISSPLLTAEEGLERFKRACRHPGWERCSFWFYIVPPGLGLDLFGAGETIADKIWQRKWKMDSAEKLHGAINQVTNQLL